jgi:hypothetical protein
MRTAEPNVFSHGMEDMRETLAAPHILRSMSSHRYSFHTWVIE